MVQVVTNGLSPTVHDDSEEENEEDDEGDDEEEMTLWSLSMIQLHSLRVSQFKGETNGAKPSVVTSPGGGAVQVTAGSVVITAGGTMTVMMGKSKKVVSDQINIMRQQGSDAEDDADEEDTVTIRFTNAAGKKEERKVSVQPPEQQQKAATSSDDAHRNYRTQSSLLLLYQVQGVVKVHVKGDVPVSKHTGQETMAFESAELHVIEAPTLHNYLSFARTQICFVHRTRMMWRMSPQRTRKRTRLWKRSARERDSSVSGLQRNLSTDRRPREGNGKAKRGRPFTKRATTTWVRSSLLRERSKCW